MREVTIKEMVEFIHEKAALANALTVDQLYDQLTPNGELWPVFELYERVAVTSGEWDRLPTDRPDDPEIGQFYWEPKTRRKWVYTGAQHGWV
jgi:hypothetical protein